MVGNYESIKLIGLKKESYRNLTKLFINDFSHFQYHKKIKINTTQLINFEWKKMVVDCDCLLFSRFYGKNIALEFRQEQVVLWIEKDETYRYWGCEFYEYFKNKTEFQMALSKDMMVFLMGGTI